MLNMRFSFVCDCVRLLHWFHGFIDQCALMIDVAQHLHGQLLLIRPSYVHSNIINRGFCLPQNSADSGGRCWGSRRTSHLLDRTATQKKKKVIVCFYALWVWLCELWCEKFVFPQSQKVSSAARLVRKREEEEEEWDRAKEERKRWRSERGVGGRESRTEEEWGADKLRHVKEEEKAVTGGEEKWGTEELQMNERWKDEERNAAVKLAQHWIIGF